jgi:hypothetical protein
MSLVVHVLFGKSRSLFDQIRLAEERRRRVEETEADFPAIQGVELEEASQA